MINKDIIAIKDNILRAVGETCEKIILFGSYANGTPNEDSDIDLYLVFKDDMQIRESEALATARKVMFGVLNKSIDLLGHQCTCRRPPLYKRMFL